MIFSTLSMVAIEKLTLTNRIISTVTGKSCSIDNNLNQEEKAMRRNIKIKC